MPISFLCVWYSKGSDAHLQGEQGDEGDNTSVVDPSASQRAPRKTVAERKAILEGDSRLAIVKSDEVKCQKCEKWIRLSSKMEYALGNWNKHALICCDAVYVLNVITICRALFDTLLKQAEQSRRDRCKKTATCQRFPGQVIQWSRRALYFL
jgi:hypothetical protein